jgi:hypothetical protein
MKGHEIRTFESPNHPQEIGVFPQGLLPGIVEKGKTINVIKIIPLIEERS